MDLLSDPLRILATGTLEALKRRGWRVTTAESCTGGLIAGALTEISGSSDAIGRGYVTYSNEAKHEMLGVPLDTLAQHGAVSPQTVRHMAEGALRAAGKDAQIAVAVSGIAGPGGATADKPVGTVHFGLAAIDGTTTTHHRVFAGDRTAVRLQTVVYALELVRERAG